MGYPGRTQRHYTYDEVKTVVEWTYPNTIRRYQELMAILEELGRDDEAVRLKASGLVRGMANYLTNRQGMLEGLIDASQVAGLKRRDGIATSNRHRSKHLDRTNRSINRLKAASKNTCDELGFL